MSAKKLLQLGCVVASFGSLVWLLSRIGWPTIATALGHIGWVSASVLVILGVAEGLFDSLALRVVTGPTLRVGAAMAINSAGTMMNLILPWESGEVLKGGLLHGDLGGPRAASSTVVWNYIFKISRPAFSLSAALVAVLLYRGRASSAVSSAVLGWVVAANILAFAPYLILRFAVQLGGTEKTVALLRRLPYLRRSPVHWVQVARAVDREVRGFWRQRTGAFVQVFALQVLARSTGWMNIYFGFRAVGAPYGFAQATLLYATMNVAEYLIALLPARVGVSEGTAFFVFRFYNLDAGLGLVLYSFLRVRNILVHGLIAPFAFVNRKATPGASSAAAVPPVPDAHQETAGAARRENS
jgi:hypothetical protein